MFNSTISVCHDNDAELMQCNQFRVEHDNEPKSNTSWVVDAVGNELKGDMSRVKMRHNIDIRMECSFAMCQCKSMCSLKFVCVKLKQLRNEM